MNTDKDNEFMNIILILTNTNTTYKEYHDTINALKENHEFAFAVSELTSIFTDLRVLLNDAKYKKYISQFRAMLRDILQHHFDLFVAILYFIEHVGLTISFYDYFHYFIGGHYVGKTYCYCLNMCNIAKEKEDSFLQIIIMLQKYNKFDMQSLPMNDEHKKILSKH